MAFAEAIMCINAPSFCPVNGQLPVLVSPMQSVQSDCFVRPSPLDQFWLDQFDGLLRTLSIALGQDGTR
jgi:hypothetical protein